MINIQVTVRDMLDSKKLEETIHKRAEKLKQFNKHVQTCKVVAHMPQKHKQNGKIYSLHIDVVIPGKEFSVTRKSSEDAHIAVRDAFDVVERQIEEYTRKHRQSFRQPAELNLIEPDSLGDAH